MSKSVDQVELAKTKIKSFEKNKNIDSLVSIIRDALSELSPVVKDETSFKSEREVYVHYILNCLAQFISEKQPNRDSLIRAFNLGGRKKGRPSKKVEGLEFSFEELKIFLDVFGEYERTGKKKSLEKAVDVVADKHHCSEEKVRGIIVSFGGKKEWERRYKKKFYSDFPASFHEARLDSLKRSKLKNSEEYKNASSDKKKALEKELLEESKKLILADRSLSEVQKDLKKNLKSQDK